MLRGQFPAGSGRGRHAVHGESVFHRSHRGALPDPAIGTIGAATGAGAGSGHRAPPAPPPEPAEPRTRGTTGIGEPREWAGRTGRWGTTGTGTRATSGTGAAAAGATTPVSTHGPPGVDRPRASPGPTDRRRAPAESPRPPPPMVRPQRRAHHRPWASPRRHRRPGRRRRPRSPGSGCHLSSARGRGLRAQHQGRRMYRRRQQP